jgi:hypothetical protein
LVIEILKNFISLFIFCAIEFYCTRKTAWKIICFCLATPLLLDQENSMKNNMFCLVK